MAKQAESKVDAVVKRVLAEMAPVVEANAQADDSRIDDIGAFDGQAFENIDGTLCPTAKFETVGQYVVGILKNIKNITVGGREQVLYVMEDKVNGEFGVWGTTILNSMLEHRTDAIGKLVGIQYLGDVATGRKLNEAKRFRVRIART